jgi:hypothetical protein
LAIVDHLTLNVMILAFWWHTLKSGMDSRLRAFTDAAMVRRSELMPSLPTASVHRLLYPELAQLALKLTDKDELRSRLIDAVDGYLAHDREGSFAYDLPATDRAEFSKIRLILAAGFGEPG